MWGSPAPPGDVHISLEAGYDLLLSNADILQIHIIFLYLWSRVGQGHAPAALPPTGTVPGNLVHNHTLVNKTGTMYS
jgi:hypothetical protein